MIRRGVTDQPAPPPEEHPLFGRKAQAQLLAIQASDVWLGLRAGMEAQREALLSTPLNTQAGETLEARWGAIQQLSLLLHGGPQMILQAQQLQAKDEPTDEDVPDYVPKVHMAEGV